jgi:hypothetical protein
MKRELQRIPIYECRCDERLKTKAEGSTRLAYTGLLGGLEHLKIETSDSDLPGRLIGGNEQGSQVHNVLSQEVLLDVEQAILVYQTPQIPLVQFPPASSTARVKLRRDQP